jgi:hypothetical protein
MKFFYNQFACTDENTWLDKSKYIGCGIYINDNAHLFSNDKEVLEYLKVSMSTNQQSARINLPTEKIRAKMTNPKGLIAGSVVDVESKNGHITIMKDAVIYIDGVRIK